MPTSDFYHHFFALWYFCWHDKEIKYILYTYTITCTIYMLDIFSQKHAKLLFRNPKQYYIYFILDLMQFLVC